MSDQPKVETSPSQGLRRIEPRGFSLMPQSLGEAKEIAGMIAASDFAPKDYKGKPNNIIIALQMGADLGLKPMQALQNIAVINGRPSIYGDAALALVQAGDVLERFFEGFEGKEGTDDFTAVCIAKRKGWPDETRRTFSVADAKAAKLWMKTGRDGQPTPWVHYPKRMLQFRARGFTLRDIAADLLLGLVLAEEAMDYPEAIDSQVIATELVVPAIERIPEGLRDNMEKAFETLSMSAAQRLAKVNEFLGKDGVSPEEGAQALLDWCRDEFAKRKTGQPRKKADNGKSAPPPAPSAQAASSVVDPKQGESDVRAVGPEALEEPTSPPTPSQVPVHEIPWAKGDMF